MYSRREFAAATAALAAKSVVAAKAPHTILNHRPNTASLEGWLGSLVAQGQFVGMVAAFSDKASADVIGVGSQDLSSRSPMAADTLFRVASLTKPMTAAAAMMLVDDGIIGLDEPVDAWLPELRNRQVIRRLDAELDDTVPARRPIRLRDLLTMQMGLGAIFADPARSPLIRRMTELEVAPGPTPFSHDADEYMKRLAGLPLACQPGTQWLYHTGMDVAGILIERASGISLGKFLSRRLFEPAGMADSSFQVTEADVSRVAEIYAGDGRGSLVPSSGRFPDASRAPAMEFGGGGLISSARDFLTFGRLMLNRGMHRGRQLVSRKSVSLMTSDHLSSRVKAASPFFPGFWDTHGWGLGMCVSTRTDAISRTGRFGWWGGTGTTFFADPATGRVAVLMTQRMMSAPNDTAVSNQFLHRIFST